MDVAPHFRFRSRLALILAVAAFSLLPLRAEEDRVIYPRPPAAVDSPAAPKSAGANTTLLLFAVVAAGAGGWLLWKQRQNSGSIAGKDGRKLSITETRGLGNRQYLVVADYEGRKFLLGVCPGRIDLLSPLDGSSPPPRTP